MKIVWQFPEQLYKQIGRIIDSSTGEELSNFCIVGINGRTVLEVPKNALYKVIFRGYPAFDVPVGDIPDMESPQVDTTTFKIYGGDIYIQDTQPVSDRVFVWIDTSNIDILQ